jgi:APA family basic amino acid/polyamine antiporter
MATERVTRQPIRDVGAYGAEGEEHPGGLKRVIGRRMLLLFVIGDILGAGIYALTGAVAGEVGGAVWVSFAAAFLLAFLTAAGYVELVGKYPRAAGAALYTQQAYRRPFLTFMVAFAVMASGITSAAAASRSFGGRYLAEFFDAPTVLIAVAFLLILAGINYRGISESIKVNLVLTLIELSGLLIIIGIGVYTLLAGTGEPSRALEFDTSRAAPLAVLAGAALAFYALLGFEDAVNLVEETKSPRQDFPRALFGGIALAGCIYLAVAFTASMVLETGVLRESSGPLLEVVRAAGITGSYLPKAFALIALIAITNTALINMIMASRLVYGMANQRIIPSPLGRVQPVRRSPYVAIAFTTALAVILAATGDLADLAATTVLLLLTVFLVVNVSVLVLRREPAPAGSYRAPTAFPVLGVVACAVLISPLSGREADVYLRGLVLVGLGVLLWAVNWLAHGRHAQPLRAEELAG